MKKFKKIMAVVAAATLTMGSMTVPAMAADTNVSITYHDTVATSSTTLPGTASVVSVSIPDGQESVDYTVDSAFGGQNANYQFVGWSTTGPNAAGTLATTVSSLKVTANDDLYSVWKEKDTNPYSITIDNAYPDETYSIYKIFNVTYADENQNPGTVPVAPNPDNTSQNKHYAYTMNDTWAWWDAVTDSAVSDPQTQGYASSFTKYGLKFTKNTNANEWNVEIDNFTATEAAALAVVLNAEKASLANAKIDDYVAPGQNFTVYPGTKGYFFVDTTMGSFCSLDTTEPAATIREKNTMPTIEKKVSTDGSNWDDKVTASVGDTLHYQITVTDGIGTDAEMTVHDELDLGVTLNVGSIALSDGTNPIPSSYYTVYYSDSAANINDDPIAPAVALPDKIEENDGDYDDDCTFEVVFTATGMAAIDSGSNIIITYTGKMNQNANIGSGGNGNTTWLTYSEQKSAKDEVTAYTYAAGIYKYNQDAEELANAQFGMKTPSSADMYFKLLATGAKSGSTSSPSVYYYDSSITASSDDVDDYTTTLTTPASGAILIYGLKDATYTLTETKAPDGYYPLTSAESLMVYKTTGVLSTNLTDTTDNNKTATYEKEKDDYYSSQQYELYCADTRADTTAQGDAVPGNNVVMIENKTGTELPSTGGMGTTVLYIVGGMLVVLAGAYLFFSRKKTA